MEGILIPVKPLGDSKRRLSSLLDEEQRRRLTLAMLADVLRATDKWTTRLLVTSDADAEAVGLAFGCELLPDPNEGLNSAVEMGMHSASSAGVDSLLVLPSDVPFVTSDDASYLFSDAREVVVAPSADGGTNALRCSPAAAIKPAFGPHSAKAHKLAAMRSQRSFKLIERDSLLLDIDRYEDLESLAADPRPLESVRVASILVEAVSRVSGAPAREPSADPSKTPGLKKSRKR